MNKGRNDRVKELGGEAGKADTGLEVVVREVGKEDAESTGLRDGRQPF